MTPRRVAVLGGYGQLGSDLVPELQARGHEVVPLGRSELDCTDPAAVAQVLAALRPDVVINCAAYVRVDDCEDHPAEALRVNALGALYVARACADVGATCIYISTDYVFDGQKGQPYTEEDPPCPINVYGASKLMGELFVRAYAPDHLIVRTSGLYGLRGSRGKGGNFVETMIRLAREGRPIRVVADQVLTPTFTRDLAHTLGDLLDNDIQGLVHVTNSGQCSWYEFAREIFRLSAMNPILIPVKTEEYPTKACRPAFSVLAHEALRRCGLTVPRPWNDALQEYLRDRSHREADDAGRFETGPRPHGS